MPPLFLFYKGYSYHLIESINYNKTGGARMHIGTKIRQLRKENKDTLKSLAEKIDYDLSNLSKIERGSYGITPELLSEILRVYKVEPNDFLGLSSVDIDPQPNKTYKFIVDGIETTDMEITEAVRLIRHFRSGKD